MCSKPLGNSRRRCKTCGSCEDCCRCEPDQFVPFSPAELGLDPEHYDVELYERAPKHEFFHNPRRRRA